MKEEEEKKSTTTIKPSKKNLTPLEVDATLGVSKPENLEEKVENVENPAEYNEEPQPFQSMNFNTKSVEKYQGTKHRIFNPNFASGFYSTRPPHQRSNTPMSPSTNNQYYQSYHKRRNYKDTFGYNPNLNIRTNRDKYQKDITLLKNNQFSNEEFNYSHSGSFYPKKRYVGFTSYAVPRTDELHQGEQSNAFRNYTQSINKSMNCFVTKNPSDTEFTA